MSESRVIVQSARVSTIVRVSGNVQSARVRLLCSDSRKTCAHIAVTIAVILSKRVFSCSDVINISILKEVNQGCLKCSTAGPIDAQAIGKVVTKQQAFKRLGLAGTRATASRSREGGSESFNDSWESAEHNSNDERFTLISYLDKNLVQYPPVDGFIICSAS